MTFAYAAGSLYRKSINSMVRAERLSCDAEVRPWKDGDVMLKYLKNVSLDNCVLFCSVKF